jgi:hypothetical protein
VRDLYGLAALITAIAYLIAVLKSNKPKKRKQRK